MYCVEDCDSESEEMDIKIEMNLFDDKIVKQEDHFIIGYTNQTSPGQSGGPLLLHLENKKPLLLGIHVSGEKVSISYSCLDIIQKITS